MKFSTNEPATVDPRKEAALCRRRAVLCRECADRWIEDARREEHPWSIQAALRLAAQCLREARQWDAAAKTWDTAKY